MVEQGKDALPLLIEHLMCPDVKQRMLAMTVLYLVVLRSNMFSYCLDIAPHSMLECTTLNRLM